MTRTANALAEYEALIRSVDQQCERIRQKYAEYMKCVKGCLGNCCRIHISVFPVAAVYIARALQRQLRERVDHIQEKARRTGIWGPCPLLEDGACLLYDARTVLCRTHGFPILSIYRGQHTIGYCQKNFQNLANRIPEANTIDLNCLNRDLNEINRRFVQENANRWRPGDRLTMGEALLLKI